MRYAIAILLLAGCSTPSVQPIDFVPIISVAVGVADSTSTTPEPAPTPKGECENCGGTGKVGDGTVFVPCAVCGGDGKIESEPVVKTPLVEKVLPKPAKVQPKEPEVQKKPSEAAKPTMPFDGQLSPRGQWKWSQAQWAWIPVPQPGPKWLQNGRSATVDHLVRVHGMSAEAMQQLTPAQRDTLHSSLHNARTVNGVRTVYPPVLNPYCPSGRCPRR